MSIHNVLAVLVGLEDCASEGAWMNGPEVSMFVHVLMLVSWLRHLAHEKGQSRRAMLRSLRCCLPLAGRLVDPSILRQERLPNVPPS